MSGPHNNDTRESYVERHKAQQFHVASIVYVGAMRERMNQRMDKLLDKLKFDILKGQIFSGEKLFELKTTHGLPLDFVLARVMNELGMRVSWVDFIEAARKNGWWDFQTYDVMCHALADAEIPRDTIGEIKKRFQLYVLKHPHPKMKEENT